MTYGRGGAGKILILSVCQCQEHTTDNCFCLCDQCPNGGGIRPGIYCQCIKHGENECSCLLISVSTVEENRSSLNTVSAKSIDGIFYVVV